MDNVTIYDMLKIVGHWIEATKFAEFVAKKRRKTVRQAQRDISKALKNKKISKALKNKKILRCRIEKTRIFLYGLAEFGPPEDYCYKVMYFDCGLDKLFGDKPRIIWESE